MSEVEHTPGPWTYTVEGDGGNFQLMGGEVYIVGGCGCCGSPFMNGPHEANAHLIAAAPDMLEALEQFVEEYVELVNSGDAGFWNPEDEDKVKFARAAISKAKGISPKVENKPDIG